LLTLLAPLHLAVSEALAGCAAVDDTGTCSVNCCCNGSAACGSREALHCRLERRSPRRCVELNPRDIGGPTQLVTTATSCTAKTRGRSYKCAADEIGSKTVPNLLWAAVG